MLTLLVFCAPLTVAQLRIEGDGHPEKVCSQPFFLKAGKDWRPMDWEKDVVPGSALDFSNRLDAPAGKYGFLTVSGEDMVFEKTPDKPAVFWGTTLCTQAPFLPDDWPARVAARLAAEGFNSVRIHHHDGRGRLNREVDNETTQLDPERVGQFDRLVYELKQRGLYITTDIFCTRQLAKGEIPEFPEEKFDSDAFKGLVMISDSALDNWKRYAKNWLTHVNPHTGLALKDDPVLISISMVNEGNINSHWSRNPIVEKVYLKRFEAWRSQQPKEKLAGKGEERVFAIFLTETYRARYAEMSRYLKEDLGVRVPLTDHNNGWLNVLSVMGQDYDYVDKHGYHAHPSFPKASWSLPAQFSVHSSITHNPMDVFRYPLHMRQFGKPMTMTEWDYSAPNPYRAEGPLLMSSYMMSQGWSGVWQYAYAHRRARITDEDRVPKFFFDAGSDLIKLLAFRIGSAIALDGGMKPAPIQFAVPIPGDGANFGWRWRWPGRDASTEDWVSYWNNHFPRQVDKLGMIGRFGQEVYTGSLKGKYDAVIDIAGNMPAEVGGIPVLSNSKNNQDIVREALEKNIISKEMHDPEQGIFNSSNGQIRLNSKAHTFAAITPTCEAFSVAPGKREGGAFIAIENKYGHGIFGAISVDRLPLAESDRVLLLHLTDAQGSNTHYTDAKRDQIEAWGEAPLLAARGSATAQVLTESNYQAWALDSAGRRIAEVKLTKAADGLTMPLEVFTSQGVVFAYELVRRAK
jgi:hypothetical protein